MFAEENEKMGPFEAAVEFYRFREPYPARFFELVAQRLALTRDTRMLDVACGPGNLAIGFAPYVGKCVGIDREPKMLRAARQAASAAGVNVTFVETAIEDLCAGSKSFDFLTIGRALHWLPRDATLPVFEAVLAPAARIAVCGSTTSETRMNDWTAAYKQVRKAWSSDPDESRYNIDMEQWFAPSRFRKIKDISVEHQHRVTVDDLIARALSFSNTSPAVVGEKRPKFEAEIRAAIEPFARAAEIEEELIAKATVFA